MRSTGLLLRGTRRRAAMALTGGIALISGCQPGMAPPRAASDYLPDSGVVVPIAAVINEVKCDYLDFAYSDYARQRRLAVGKATGVLHLTLSRDGTREGALGVPVAPAGLRIGGGAPGAAAQDTLTVPFEMDPRLALDPARAGLDCTPAMRLRQPIVAFTGLAAGLTDVQQGGPVLRLRSPLRYQGQFYLRQGADGVEVALAKVDPARLAGDAVFLQSFDVTIETGTASWFADLGPQTAEPRPPGERRRAALRRVPVPAPAPVALAAADPVPRPQVRVPTAPRPGIVRRASDHRCIADRTGELLCY